MVYFCVKCCNEKELSKEMENVSQFYKTACFLKVNTISARKNFIGINDCGLFSIEFQLKYYFVNK